MRNIRILEILFLSVLFASCSSSGTTSTGTAILSISNSPTLDFGESFALRSLDSTLTISNDGTGTASQIAAGTPAMSAPFSFKGGEFPGTDGTCTNTLNPGGTCTVVITFAPEVEGAFSDTLSVIYNDGQVFQKIKLDLTGSGNPCDPNSTSSFGGGDGTSDTTPFLICTATQLQNVSSALTSHFKLMTNIDLQGVAFEPIAPVLGLGFNGVFLGNFKIISNFTYSNTSVSNVGIFNSVQAGSTIKDLGIENVNIQSAGVAGGLAGTGRGTIDNCYVTGTVSATGDVVGGLVGAYGNGAISNSYSLALVSGNSYVGGLVGSATTSPSIVNSFAAGAVTGSGTNIGGLVGRFTGTETNSYWDTAISTQATSATGTGKTTSELQDSTTFTSWDFDTIWNLPVAGTSYPTLRGF